MLPTITVFVPGTVSNVGCGFDVMGFAMEGVGERLTVALNQTQSIGLRDESGYQLPLNPQRNTAAVAVESLRQRLGTQQGFDIVFRSKIKPGSGLGSSAASAVAAVYGANLLLGSPLSKLQLIEPALDGEYVASGSRHADNVAPAMLGSFTLVRSVDPLDVVAIPAPEQLFCTVVHPQIEVKTQEARAILPQNIALKTAVMQWGNTAALIAALYRADYPLLGRALTDHVVEPYRSQFIPGYAQAKAEAMEAGALGFNISGSGPTVFALSTSLATAQRVAQAVAQVFVAQGIAQQSYVGRIHQQGVMAEPNTEPAQRNA